MFLIHDPYITQKDQIKLNLIILFELSSDKTRTGYIDIDIDPIDESVNFTRRSVMDHYNKTVHCDFIYAFVILNFDLYISFD